MLTMAADNVGKFKYKRNHEAKKPYSRRQSLLGRVGDTVKEMLSPSWLVNLVASTGSKTSEQTPSQQVDKPQPQRYDERRNSFDAASLDRQTGTVPAQQRMPVMPQSRYMSFIDGPSQPNANQVPNSRAPSSGPFSSDSLPFASFKPTLPVNGGDDQSELSDYSVSTSGCSSMIPHCPEPRDYQRDVLQVNESKIQFREDPGNASSRRQDPQGTGHADENKLNQTETANQETSKVSQEESFVWSSSVSQSSQQQPPAKRHKPDFNISLFPSSSLNDSKTQYSSPYYSGRTSYGGASSHRRVRLKPQAISQGGPSSFGQVRAKPSRNMFGAGVSSSTARQILDTLDRLSTPLSDAKKIPTFNTSLIESPLSFTPSNYRRHSLPPGTSAAPPVRSMVTPQRAKIAENYHCPPSASSTPLPGSKPTKSSLDKPPQPAAAAGRSGKMRREKAHSAHYSSKRNEPPDAEEEEEAPDLPTNFTLPISNMPKIDFSSSRQPPKTSIASIPSSSSAPCAAQSSSVSSPTFQFSSPIEKWSNAGSASPVMSKSQQEFQFSSPINVDKSSESSTNKPQLDHKVLPSSVSSQSKEISHSLTMTTTASSSSSSSSSTSMQFKSSVAPVVSAPKPSFPALKTSAKSDEPSASVKPASQLKSGSVSDALAKMAEERSKQTAIKPASELKQGSVSDILGKSSGASKLVPLSEVFKRAADTWECPMCMIANKDDLMKCAACMTDKPSSAPPAAQPSCSTQLIQTSKAGGDSLSSLFKKPAGTWECPTCWISNKPDAETCPACMTSKPSTSAAKTVDATSKTISQIASVEVKNDLASLFKKAPGDWECPTCMVHNKADQVKCPACDTSKPGGSNAVSSSQEPAASQAIPLSELFKKAADSWDCTTCMVNNKGASSKCVACETPKPGCKPSQSFTSPGGFQFKKGGGFSFGSSLPNKDSVTAPISASETTPTTGGFKIPMISSTVSSNGGFSLDKPITNKTGFGDSGGFKFNPPSSTNETTSSVTTTTKNKRPLDDDSNSKNSSLPVGGFKFGGSTSEKSGEGIKFGINATSETPESKSTNVGGFKFGASDNKPASEVTNVTGGFKFGGQGSEKTVVSSSGNADKPTGGFKLTFGVPSSAGNATETNTTGGFKFGGASNENTSTSLFKFGNSGSADANKLITNSTQATDSIPSQSSSANSVSSTSTPGIFSATVNNTSQNPAVPMGGFKFNAPVENKTDALPQKSDSGISSLNSAPKSVASSIFGGIGSGSMGQTAATAGPTLPKYEAVVNKSSAAPAPSLFQFGATQKAAPSSVPAVAPAVTVAFGAGSQTDASNKPAVNFAFGNNQSTSSAPSGIFSFGAGPKSSDASKPLGASSSASQPFSLGNSGTVQNMASVQNVPSFGASTNAGTPAFGGFGAGSNTQTPSSNPSVFGSGVPSFGTAATATPSVPSFGGPQTASSSVFSTTAAGQAPPMNNANPPSMPFNSTPSFNFGSNAAPEPDAGVFKFGSNSNASAPSTGGFNFGAPPMQQQAPQPSGFNFPAAPSAPTPTFGAATPPAGMAPSANPFNASSQGRSARPIKRAVRKLRK